MGSASRNRGKGPEVLAEAGEVEELAGRLAGASRCAVDVEGATFYRYADLVYLLQVSEGGRDYVIDTMAPGVREALAALSGPLADPDIEVVFHEAAGDLRALERDFGFRVRRIWDTRIAAQLAGEKAFGLGSLLERYLGVRLSKKLQRADWSRRPLSPDMLAYAAADTAHLLELRDRLEEKLRAAGRLAWVEEELVLLEDMRYEPITPREQFLRLKGVTRLPDGERFLLERLWLWREHQAEARDLAPFRIANNEVLFALASERPTSEDALRRIRAVPPAIGKRYGGALLRVIREALDVPERDWPRLERAPRRKRDPAVDARFERLRKLRSRRAKALGLDPGTICPNAALQAVAEAAPASAADLDAIAVLRRWQREAMDEARLLDAI